MVRRSPAQGGGAAGCEGPAANPQLSTREPLTPVFWRQGLDVSTCRTVLRSECEAPGRRTAKMQNTFVRVGTYLQNQDVRL